LCANVENTFTQFFYSLQTKKKKKIIKKLTKNEIAEDVKGRFLSKKKERNEKSNQLKLKKNC